ncbi:unnamed protein product [Blepharisma stoltei]|uniref:Potassium channel domain-containing protein n=1 Tax=Blepharisma stoltei TaxID=1481888 RepID=A0AAU9IKE9_9CILI|nr:unnamed protein product [Blepharisma stoltei]
MRRKKLANESFDIPTFQCQTTPTLWKLEDYIEAFSKNAKKSWFHSVSENEKKIEQQFNRLKISELLINIAAWSGFIVGAIIADSNEHQQVDVDIEFGMKILYFLSSLSTFILLIFLIIRNYFDLEWKKERLIYSKQDNLYSAGYIPKLIVELAYNLFHPVWFLDDSSYEYYCEYTHSYIEYPWNTLLSVIQVSRVYHLMRLWIFWSKYNAPRAQRVCKMNGTEGGALFFFRGMMTDNPMPFVGIMLFVGIMMFSYMLRIFETPLAGKNNNQNFGDFNNSMWNVVITVFTVGYGDTFPVTLPGRIIEVFNSIYGNILLSMMIVSLTTLLNFEIGERKAVELLERLNFQIELKHSAARLLTSAFRYRVLLRKGSATPKQILIQSGKIVKSIAAFRATRAKRKGVYQIDTAEHIMEKKVNLIRDATEAHKNSLLGSLRRLQRVKQKFDIYFNIQK